MHRRPPFWPLALMLPLLAAAAAPVVVSQKHRSFQPATAELEAGQTLRVVNDDGELIHHAYVKASDFEFDSGEQDPGATASIRFPRAGHYTVLCAVHPKMRLDVTVK